MANNPISANARSYHGTTSAGNVDVITLDKPYVAIEIVTRDDTNDLWVTVDTNTAGGGSTSTAPVVAAAGTYFVGPGGAARTILDDGASSPVSVVRIIGALHNTATSAAVAYSVTGQT